jgi:hypothetical protein
MRHRYLVVLFLFLQIGLAVTGRVNIFTGDKTADIYIDGEKIGSESVTKHSLEEGKHYLQIKKGDKVLKAQSFVVYPDKVETIVADDFVEYKTNVASRGAIDVEAMRVRETRGNFAFGLHGGSPASGLSVKWWPFEKFGIQAIGLVNNFSGNTDSRGGARLLFNLNESVYQGGTLTYYLAAGAGKAMLRNYNNGESNELYDLSEAAVGLEFKIANFFDQQSAETKHVVIDEHTDPFSILLTQLIIGIGEGFFKIAHFNVEFGVERTLIIFHDPEREESNRSTIAGKLSGGFHIYF